MSRVVTVIVATLGGLALLASFHTTPGVSTRPVTRGQVALRPPAGGASPNDGPTTPASVATTVPATRATGGAAGPTTPPTTAGGARKTIVGPVVSNPYGDVQVEIVVRGGRLVDVEAVELPMERQLSAEINNIAGPDLRQEALQAGSAQIDVITGATFTSDSYAQSLQAALDQAGIRS